MATIRGILVKRFGGPEVLEYVHGISSPPKPSGRQVYYVMQCISLIISIELNMITNTFIGSISKEIELAWLIIFIDVY